MTKRGVWHRVVRMASALVIAYALLTVAAFAFAERVIFQPPPASYAVDDLPFRRIGVGDGDSVAVLYLPNDSAQYTILYSHGNAEDLGYLFHVLRALREAGFSVIGYDYRGYGQSTGSRPTVGKATEDAEAVYQFAVHELGVEPDRLILHGRSLGSGPTMALAMRHPVAGIVLESAFTSTYRVLTSVRLLPFDRFRNIDCIGNVQSPVLVIHGADYWLIPPAHGRQLFTLAPEPKQSLWVDGAGHNDLVHIAGGAYTVALQQFAVLADRYSAGPLAR